MAEVVRRPEIEVSAGERWHHLELVSSLSGRWARIRYPRERYAPAVGDQAEVSIGGTVLLSGPVTFLRPLRRVWQATVEPEQSRELRGEVERLVGPRAWKGARAADVAGELLEQVDAEALPDVRLTSWSIPEVATGWALQALLRTVSALSGEEVVHVLDADGTARLGPWGDLVRDSGLELVSPLTVLRRRGIVVETFAAPLAAADQVIVDGEPRVCEHVRTEAEAGRYRSHLTLGAAA